MQAHSFATERQDLLHGYERSKHVKQFNLFLDDDKIIRCKGRINNADTTEEGKNPVLLPSRHRYTELLIRERHDHVHHNGVRETLNAIRETHWVLKGREAVKRVIRKCTICIRYEGKPFTAPSSPDLPTDRVNEGPPFTSLLTFEEPRTLVVEIEATLNNRPLTYIYDDEEGPSYPLTPADLIYGRQIATMPHQRHCNVISTFQSLTKRARYRFRLLEGFTKQRRKEYLLGLREYHRNRTGAIEQSIRVGDIVVLKEEGSARCLWKLAKVTELLKSRDNVVRSAKIQVLNTDAQRRPTMLRRAVQHLIPLAVNHS
ncbi:uncharacterized protein [Porites lutea]|uniref:uncharacterized protein n=1 Tax=Porites lutea TaxID=51062 RepID=UPI003CC58A1D